MFPECFSVMKNVTEEVAICDFINISMFGNGHVRENCPHSGFPYTQNGHVYAENAWKYTTQGDVGNVVTNCLTNRVLGHCLGVLASRINV